MITFFTQHGYPFTSLQQDLCRVTTIGRLDALGRSECGDKLLRECLWSSRTTHLTPTSNGIYFRTFTVILSTYQQHKSIFRQPPFVAYKRDLGPRDIVVQSTDNSSTEQPGSHACRCSWCHTCKLVNPLTEMPGPKSTFTIAVISPAF